MRSEVEVYRMEANLWKEAADAWRKSTGHIESLWGFGSFVGWRHHRTLKQKAERLTTQARVLKWIEGRAETLDEEAT